MKLEDLIKRINILIEVKRTKLGIPNNIGHLVIKRTNEMNSSFKAYRKLTISLWFVQKKKTVKVLELSESFKILNENDTTAWNKLEFNFIGDILNLLDSKIFIKIIEGTYETV